MHVSLLSAKVVATAQSKVTDYLTTRSREHILQLEPNVSLCNGMRDGTYYVRQRDPPPTRTCGGLISQLFDL